MILGQHNYNNIIRTKNTIIINTILEGPASWPHVTLLCMGNFALENKPNVGQTPIKCSRFSVVLKESFNKFCFANKENYCQVFEK